MNLENMAVMTTACRRPYYLQQSLDSWEAARGVGQLGGFFVALGGSDRADAQRQLIEEYDGRTMDIEVWPDRATRLGPHRAIGEAARRVFQEHPGIEFLVFGEEDVLVSDDVLEYMRWAAGSLRREPSVLAACAHDQAGQGWDPHTVTGEADADPRTVRLLPYFNAWCWGTWRERWEKILEPEWDWDCTSGGPMDSGYDWNIQSRVLPRHGMRCAVPLASRSQNIGQEEGVYSTPASWEFAQTPSFREHRPPGVYTLEGSC